LASSPSSVAPQPGRGSLVVAVAVAVAGVLAVTFFGLFFARGSALTSAELAVVSSLNELRVGVVGAVASLIYVILSPIPAIAMTAVATAVIWLITRRLTVAMTFAVVVAVAWLPSALVKALVHRPRPDPQFLSHPLANQPVDASYPSGHEVFIAAVAVVAFLMVSGGLARALVAAAGVVGITAVGFSLVITGAHHPTDVAASVLWAVTTVPAIMLIWRRWVLPPLERWLRPRRIGPVAQP